MSYNYEDEKKLLDHETHRALVATALKARAVCAIAGAVRMDKLIDGMPGVGNSWRMLAVVDRLLELGFLIELSQPEHTAGQYRVFRWASE